MQYMLRIPKIPRCYDNVHNGSSNVPASFVLVVVKDCATT